MIDYGDVLSVLSWRVPDTLHAQLHDTKIRWTSRRFHSFIEALRLQGDLRADAIVQGLHALPSGQQIEVMSAPDAFEAYRSLYPERQVGFFENAIQFLHYEHDSRELRDGDYWSPDRSVHLVVRAKKIERFVAPCVLGSVPLDFDSPTTRGALRHVSGRDVPMCGRDRTEAISRIRRGVELIAAVEPRAEEFVRNYAASITVRNDPDDDTCSSASTSDMLGRVFLRNVVSGRGTPGVIAAGLIHECVHSVLDHCELAEPLLTVSIDYSYRVQSPWSGRLLDLNTYIQACFVWYALWQFWWRALALERYSEPDGPGLAGLALQGFKSSGILLPIEQSREMISPRVYDVLGAAQEDVAAVIRN